MAKSTGYWATGNPDPEVMKSLRVKLRDILTNAISNGNGSIQLEPGLLKHPDNMRVYALASYLDELGWELSFTIEPREGAL